MVQKILIALFAFLWAFPAVAQEQVNVRAGVHPSYTRVVFDWDKTPQYTVNKSGNTLNITFNTAATVDFSDVVSRDLPNIVDAKIIAQDGSKLEVAITIPPSSRHRDFSTDGRVILDIYNPGGEKSITAVDTVKKPEQQAKKDEKPKEEQEKQEQAQPAVDVPSADEDKPESVAREPADEEETQTVEKQILAPPSIEAHSILFTATHAFGMGVFKRENWLWLVLDDPDVTVPPQLSGPNEDKFEEFQKYELIGGVAYRLRIPDNMYVYAKGGGLTWDIVITPYKPDNREPVLLEREFDDADPVRGASLIWPSDKTRKSLELNDPSIGDTIQIITTDYANVFAGDWRDFVELSKLDSYVGLAMIPKIDDLEISRLSDKVLISRPGGLALTRPKDYKAMEINKQTKMDLDPYAPEQPQLEPMKRIYNFAAWQMGGLQALEENQTLLMSGLRNKSENDQITDLLTLAKLNMANRRAQEALGFLKISEDMRPDIAKGPEFLALRGAASSMAGWHDDALIDFSRKELEPYDEINYWKAYTLANVEDWQQAYEVIPKRFDVLAEYPEQMRIPMTLTSAEVLLRGGEPEIAERLLNDMGDLVSEREDADNAAWRYLVGEMERQKGNIDGAIERWKSLERDKDDLYRVKASLALSRLEQEEKQLSIEEVIDRLESLRYAWRGDQLETMINYRLAQAYVEQGDYLKGLNLMRNAATFTPGTKISAEITAKLTQLFRDIFANDAINNISPLDAIALYDEFKELTPPGREGDMMAIKLAERLASADLLGRASKILEMQVTRRLDGEEKVKTAIRLAGIQLLDDKPNGTIRTLEVAEEELNKLADTSGDGFKSKYMKEISLLRARALSDQGKTGAALTLLNTLGDDKNVMRLRADLAWKDARWEDAAEYMQDLIYSEDISLNRPINEYQAELILSRAIALNLSSNRVALSNLRERYGSVMEQTQKARLFDVVTRERQARFASNREVLTDMIGEVDLFGEFLDSYKSSVSESN